MGIYAIKPKFQKSLTPVKDLFIKYKVSPTTINVLGLVMSIFMGLTFVYADIHVYWLLIVPVLAFTRTALNALDGVIARELKVKNQEWGEVMNEFMDRISDVIILLGLGLSTYTNPQLGYLATIVVLLNSYLSIVSKAAGGKRQYGGLMGKADRMIVVSVMAMIIVITKLYIWADYALAIILVGTIITLIQRFLNTKSELLK